ncbi:unnamed protein product [Pleuronectes platessa]|uniref:Uncharacterized protein n=1 Tax=Pleuronectes platessa TaxID=8262 RepID=A0A9N7TVJ8_PLEPL|nr:unnamed protein product [Pleuronectes platessa]
MRAEERRGKERRGKEYQRPVEVGVLADYSLGESPEVRLELQQQQGYNFSVGGLGGLGLFLLTPGGLPDVSLCRTRPRGLQLKRGSVQHLQIALHDHFLLPTHSSQATLCAKAEKSANRGVQSTQGLSTGPYSSSHPKLLPAFPLPTSASDEGEKNDALYGHCKKPFMQPQLSHRECVALTHAAQAHWRPVLEAEIEKVASVHQP